MTIQKQNIRGFIKFLHSTKLQFSFDFFPGKEAFPKKRRILVLINPKSGNGASVSKFKKFVEPIFKDAGIFYHQFVTSLYNTFSSFSYLL